MKVPLHANYDHKFKSATKAGGVDGYWNRSVRANSTS